jgi:RHS repeat-associated protein
VAYDPETNRALSNEIRYDANGNIIHLFDMDLAFDIQNRLTRIERTGEGAEEYGYNPSNLRIWKKTVAGDEEIHFYGSGGRRLATYRLAVDGEGNCAVALMNCEMYFAGRLLHSDNKPVVLDRLGTVHAWIDDKRNVTRAKYYPFGEERQVTKNNREKFGTYIRDDFSNLDYAEQRYYSSALGRFITPDPFHGSVIPAKPETWNRYAYVANDPVNTTDPHGLSGMLPAQPSSVYVQIFPLGNPYFYDNQSSPTTGECGVEQDVNIYFYINAENACVDSYEHILPISVWQNNCWVKNSPIFYDHMWEYRIYDEHDQQDAYDYFGSPNYTSETQTQWINILWPPDDYRPCYQYETTAYNRTIESYAPYSYTFYTELYLSVSYCGIVYGS